MTSYMEELLGVKAWRDHIPGTTTDYNSSVIYIEDDRKNAFDLQLEALFDARDKVGSAGDGSMMEDYCRIYLPDDQRTLFHAIVYRGDLSGWRKDIEAGAKALGLLTATIQKDRIVLSDSRSYKLSDCKVEDDLACKNESMIQEETKPFIYQESESISKYRAEAMLEQIDFLKKLTKFALQGTVQELALQTIEHYKEAIIKDPKLWSNFEDMFLQILKNNKISITTSIENYLNNVGEIMQLAK